jgi:hypothetical protein
VRRLRDFVARLRRSLTGVTRPTSSETEYVVVLETASDARVPDGGIRIATYPTPVGGAAFRFLTQYEDRGFEEKVPRLLQIEARGVTAAGINETINAYANAASSFLPLIALAANAWVGEPDIKLAFDATPGRSEREFFQSFTTELEPDAVRFGREIDREATVALIVAIGTHVTEGERLRRAAEQYRMALSNWLRGQEALAIGHLWMAVEALTKVALRRECGASGLTKAALAESWGIQLRELDGEVRRRLIFQGDAESARKAREASDGLEHAYLDFGEVRDLAVVTTEM